jgi:hypothetical protein
MGGLRLKYIEWGNLSQWSIMFKSGRTDVHNEQRSIRPSVVSDHLDLDTSWRWLFSFTLRSLYPRGESLLHPLARRPPEPVGTKERSQNSWPYRDSELRPLGRPAHSESLYRLRYLGKEGESVNRSQIDIKRKICDIRIWKKNIYFSTYPPPTVLQLSDRFTNASKPAT